MNTQYIFITNSAKSSFGEGIFAAALANMEIYQEQHLVENSAKMGEIMYEGLLKLAEKHPSIDRITGKWGLYHGVQCVPALCTVENGQKIMNCLMKVSMWILIMK